MEELERARKGDRPVEVRNPQLESLRLAHVEMTRQLKNTTNEQRRRAFGYWVTVTPPIIFLWTERMCRNSRLRAVPRRRRTRWPA